MRIRNEVLFLLPFLFLVSCDKIELSEDVTRLIYSPTLEDAKAKVKTVSASNINTIYDENNVEIGKETYTLSIDRTEFKEDYSYKRRDTYSGTRVVMDTSYSTSLMVSEKNISVSYNADTSCYEVSVLLKGYLASDETKTEKEVNAGIFQYKQGQFESEIDNKVFYSNNVSSRYTGGYYMADFFKTILSEYKSFSVKDNCLVYTIKDKIYKASKNEKALVNEELVMNDFGMLVSMEQSALNLSNNQKAISFTSVIYNQ